MITGYRFTVFASDLARSSDFYENRLGCVLSDVTELGFTATRDQLVVTVEGGAKQRKLGKTWLAEAGLYITIVVDDFDATFADLTDARCAVPRRCQRAAERQARDGSRGP